MKINENQWKSLETNENHRKSMKIHEIPLKFIFSKPSPGKTTENFWMILDALERDASPR